MSYPLDVPTQKFIGKDFTVARYYRNKYCFSGQNLLQVIICVIDQFFLIHSNSKMNSAITFNVYIILNLLYRTQMWKNNDQYLEVMAEQIKSKDEEK